MKAGTDPMQVSVQMWMYSNALAQKKREQPDDTLISKYVHGEVDGMKISDFELNNFFVLLAVAGNETTRNATSHFMRLMSEHPDQFELLKTDVDRLLPGAIEEALRFAPPVVAFRRTAIAGHRDPRRPHREGRPGGGVLPLGQPRRGGVLGRRIASTSGARRTNTSPSASASTSASARTSPGCSCTPSCARW